MAFAISLPAAAERKGGRAEKSSALSFPLNEGLLTLLSFTPRD